MLVLSLLLAVAIVAAIVIACRPLPDPPRHRAREASEVAAGPDVA